MGACNDPRTFSSRNKHTHSSIKGNSSSVLQFPTNALSNQGQYLSGTHLSNLAQYTIEHKGVKARYSRIIDLWKS